MIIENNFGITKTKSSFLLDIFGRNRLNSPILSESESRDKTLYGLKSFSSIHINKLNDNFPSKLTDSDKITTNTKNNELYKMYSSFFDDPQNDETFLQFSKVKSSKTFDKNIPNEFDINKVVVEVIVDKIDENKPLNFVQQSSNSFIEQNPHKIIPKNKKKSKKDKTDEKLDDKINQTFEINENKVKSKSEIEISKESSKQCFLKTFSNHKKHVEKDLRKNFICNHHKYQNENNKIEMRNWLNKVVKINSSETQSENVLFKPKKRKDFGNTSEFTKTFLKLEPFLSFKYHQINSSNQSTYFDRNRSSTTSNSIPQNKGCCFTHGSCQPKPFQSRRPLNINCNCNSLKNDMKKGKTCEHSLKHPENHRKGCKNSIERNFDQNCSGSFDNKTLRKDCESNKHADEFNRNYHDCPQMNRICNCCCANQNDRCGSCPFLDNDFSCCPQSVCCCSCSASLVNSCSCCPSSINSCCDSCPTEDNCCSSPPQCSCASCDDSIPRKDDNSSETVYCASAESSNRDSCEICPCPCRCPQFIKPHPYCLNTTYRMNYYQKSIPRFRRYKECDNLRLPLC